jgi:hypothetical protein
MAPINHARVISLPGLFFMMSVTISLCSARKRNSCLWRSLISTSLPGKEVRSVLSPGFLGPNHSPMRSSTQRWHWLTSARTCLRAPRPHSAPPHCLDTAPRKDAGHSGLTPNKAWRGIQAVAIGQDAHSYLLMVTFSRVEGVGQHCIDDGIPDGSLFFFPGNFQSRQALIAE